jgi:hypothetical protein
MIRAEERALRGPMLPMLRKQIMRVLALAGRWPLCTTLTIVLALALSYEVGVRADAAAPSGRFQVQGNGESTLLPYFGFDNSTGLLCIPEDPRGADKLTTGGSKLFPFCVDLLNDRTLAGRMQRRLP